MVFIVAAPVGLYVVFNVIFVLIEETLLTQKKNISSFNPSHVKDLGAPFPDLRVRLSQEKETEERRKEYLMIIPLSP